MDTSQEQQFFIDRAREDLLSFSVYTDQGANNPFRAYNPKLYHEKIYQAVEDIFYGKINKLIVSLPPQHGKSTATSINGMAWMLGKDPSLKIALASYGADLAQKFSGDCRDLVRSEKYISVFGNIVKADSQAKNEWSTNDGGKYTAVGIGGPLTGKPVDVLLIDDYIKDSEEANSKVMKNKIRDRYSSTALSRLHINSKQIIIATRRAEDDLIGRILEVEGDQWTQLIIPCYDENGEAIRPERHPKELLEQKRRVDEKTFQVMYLCNPLPEEGVYFKREYFEYYDEAEILYLGRFMKDLEVITFVDPAISQKQKADNTAIVTAGIDRKGNYIYVIDIDFGKFMPDEIINKVFEKVERFSSRVGIETNQFQKMLEIDLRKQMRIRDKFFVLEGRPSTGDKEAKIKNILQSRYSNHVILHKKHGKNVGELESELLLFPNGKHDDIIDCLAMCIGMMDVYTQSSQRIYSSDYSLDSNNSSDNIIKDFHESQW